MVKWLLLLVFFGALGVGAQAQQLGVVEAPPENETADAELDRLLRNQSSADTAYVWLRFGLFGPGAKKLYDEGVRWGKEGRWNIALAYFYRALDRKNKKTDDLAIAEIKRYGPLFLSKCAKGATEQFKAGNGLGGYSYSFRLMREIKTAQRYKVTLGLNPQEVKQLNEAAEAWAQRRLVELKELVAQKKHFTLEAELNKVGTYVPESRKTPAYQAHEAEITRNGNRTVASPLFGGAGLCPETPDVFHTGLNDRLAKQHPRLQVLDREVNQQLADEKQLADLDDRPLSEELQANLVGADYLAYGKLVVCEERSQRLKSVTVDAFQVREYKVKNEEGEEVKRLCWDVPVKLELLTGNSFVRYTVALTLYRVSDGGVVYTQRLTDEARSDVDYFFAANGVTDVAIEKVPEGSSDEPKRFSKPVRGSRQEPRPISSLRDDVAGRMDGQFAREVFDAIRRDN